MSTTIEKELHDIGLYLRDIRDILEKMRKRDEIRDSEYGKKDGSCI